MRSNWISEVLRTAFLTAAIMAGIASAQQPVPPAAQPNQQPPAQPAAPAPPPAAPATPLPPAVEGLRPNYVLGSGDQLLIRAMDAEEIGERPYRIDGNGDVTLPLVGVVRAAGVTLEEFQARVSEKLRVFVRNPQVIVTVVQFRSEPVFFVGAFRAPGIYPLQGKRTLVEMLTTIGGLQPNSSRRIKIQRRKEFGAIPLPNAAEQADGKGSMAEINLGSLRESVNPAEDIVLQPYDVISVERAELVYGGGELARPGGFELGERESISVVQLVSLAGGVSREANLKKARILRPIMNSSRRAEIQVNLADIFAGKQNDVPLLPNDLLYIPRSASKGTLTRVSYVVIPSLITTAIALAIRR